MITIYLDGKYLPVNKRLLDVFTPGIFNAKGVFETMLGVDGVVLDAPLHLKRLREGLKALNIRPPAIRVSILEKLLRLNGLSCARVRVMAWKGHVMAAALPYKFPSPKTFRACVIKTDRAATSRTANVKSLDYGLFAQAYARARAQGFDEALLTNKRGHIFEASRANIFWVKGNVLYTPPLSSGCLNGITRRQVMAQTGRLGVRVQEKNLTLRALKAADTAFLTNSLQGIILLAT